MMPRTVLMMKVSVKIQLDTLDRLSVRQSSIHLVFAMIKR